MWVRGLKQENFMSCEFQNYPEQVQSHPMWVRGLKRCILSDGSKHFEGVPSWN